MPKRILVANDLPDNIALLEFLLSVEDYEVETALGGQACLEKALRNPPDLLLLDVMMPDMDGYAVARQLKAAHLPEFPILLVTAWDVNQAAYESVGADGCIRKPIDSDALLKSVRRLLDEYANHAKLA